MTIEELRAVAGRFNSVAERMLEPWEAPEVATGEGVAVLNAVQAMANAGLSGDQIINALVLGYGGRADRILQIGMGGALAVCRMVVIGGKPEPIANNSRCDEYGAADRKLRDAFVERGLAYIPCEDASIEGVYDACSEPTAADDTTTTTVGERAASGRWTGSATETHDSESRSKTYDGTATVELRDGVYALEYRILSESQELGHDACSSTTLTTGEGSASPTDNGRLVFVGDAHVELVSDCPFYESSGGVRNETTESTKVGYLLDDDVLRLDLLPQTAIEMDRTEL